MADGKIQRGSDGKLRRDPATGKMWRDAATGTTVCCCAAGACDFCSGSTLHASLTCTFSGITLCTGCVAHSSQSSKLDGSTLDGVRTVTNNEFTYFDVCHYVEDGADTLNPIQLNYSGTSCSGSGSNDYFYAEINFRLGYALLRCPNSGLNGILFYAEFDPVDAPCGGGFTLDNANTSCGSNMNGSTPRYGAFDSFVFGTGGTLSVTFP